MASQIRLSDPSPLLSLGVNLNNRVLFLFPSIITSKVFHRSNHHLVVAMVEKIMKQAKEYGRAIDMSLDTAQKGCEFAEDAVELCNFVTKGDAHVEDLERFLSEMLDKANTAHAHALAMNQQFAGVRSSLFQVSAMVYGEDLIVTPSKDCKERTFRCERDRAGTRAA